METNLEDPEELVIQNPQKRFRPITIFDQDYDQEKYN